MSLQKSVKLDLNLKKKYLERGLLKNLNIFGICCLFHFENGSGQQNQTYST